MKKLTVGIPAFKAQGHIWDCLSSIQIQSMKDEVAVIVASDYPGEDYSYVKKKFPDIEIETLECKENTGPGLARQRCLDACKTDWITFIDADDVFFTPFALEQLYRGIQQNVIEVQGTFLQEVGDCNTVNSPRTMPRNDVGHPWVFGRLYNTQFLKANDIKFSELRAMEDGEFNWKIRMTVEGSPLIINVLQQDPVYLWRIGSEHSITRTGAEKDGIPQYNFDLCQLGATIASIRAAKFARKKNPFNGGVDRFITEMMVGQYFTYIECLEKKKIFAEQNLFNAKRFYHECFKEIEGRIENKVLSDIYTMQRMQHGQDLLGIIPEISFFDFMQKIKTEEYGGEEELQKIRSEYPKEIIDNDIKTGVALF
ncbi:MAG: glycosyltransferase family 2 protein [Pseudobutyrivibrio sp.]|nr:glycosyltransferase family 2 protein [Pseudobutyrivibrio sp.]